MISEKVESQINKLLLKKSRLKATEKMIREKEKKGRVRRLIELGSVVEKVEMDHMSLPSLLGALLEIKEASSKEELVKNWEEKGQEFLKKNQRTTEQRLILSFETELSEKTKKTLQENRFRRMPFRNEWYGYGKEQEFEQLLRDEKVKIEVITTT